MSAAAFSVVLGAALPPAPQRRDGAGDKATQTESENGGTRRRTKVVAAAAAPALRLRK